ncbi:MAG: hypothetical protein IPJ76_07205 [Flavobacteriales bacterium]|nr:MAG: hypothetical protein IPJ76_07205 [Flavobacteriales bacterium]
MRSICFLFIAGLSLGSQGQNIFVSGAGDGYASATYIGHTNATGVFTSGVADGYSAGSFNTPVTLSGIYKSGVADGYAGGAYNTQVALSAIYNSGAADGYAGGAYNTQVALSAIFSSGIGDGYATGAGSNVKVKVQGFAVLEGPWNTGTQLMNDGLRSAGLVPLTEPYTALGFVNAGNSGGETTTAGLLAISGTDAVVDWVRVELRDATTPTTLVAARHALLLRTGDIVDAATGNDFVEMNAPPGNYYVVVRHRNHLGVMSAAAISLSGTTTSIDFSNTATATFGTAAQKTIGSVNALWAGDVGHDGQLKYTGSSNDRDPILVAIGGSTPNNVLNNQYRTEDVNMDGTVKYTGSSNDRDPILVNIGGSTPNNVRTAQLP